MRSKFSSVLLTLIAIAALSGTAAATASAHEFVASKTGKMTIAISTPVEFSLAGAPEKVKCELAPLPTGSGTVTALKSKSLIVKVTYPDCRLSFLDLLSFTTEYEVSAEGKWTLLKTVLVEGKYGEEKTIACKWNFIPSKTEESTVGFTNSAPVKTVKGVRASKHMKQEKFAEFEECGESNETSTWAETATLGVEGGTLQWK